MYLVVSLHDVAEFTDLDLSAYEGQVVKVVGGAFTLAEGAAAGNFDPDSPLDYLTMVDADGVTWEMSVGTDGAWTSTAYSALTSEAGALLTTEAGAVLVME